MQPYELTGSAAAKLIKGKKLSCEDLVRSCLKRIEERDSMIRAWTYIDPAQAVRNARELDKRVPKGALHGLTFGVKDVIDTADMPTSQNSPIYVGHQVGRDAACVSVVRSSGALILGKTDAVEFAAFGRKALTRNPYNIAHTPGGSSSGSAAAVADKMVQFAFGTQTGGSHIRPAAFTGIYAIKPTHGAISREGAKMSSHTLDSVGWYGRSVEDLQLVGSAYRLPGNDAIPAIDVAGLVIGLCRTCNWARSEPSGRAALDAAAKRLEAAGAIVEELELPASFDELTEAQEIIMRGEARVSFLPEYLGRYDDIHQEIRELVENVRGITPEMLVNTYDHAADCRRIFDGMFGDRLDAVLTLAAPGEAPQGLQTTGDQVFCQMWTVLHAPCIAIPVGLGARRLPVGVQIVGPRFSDTKLLRIAEAVAPAIDVSGPVPGVVESAEAPA